jgi:hypothetical protein
MVEFNYYRSALEFCDIHNERMHMDYSGLACVLTNILTLMGEEAFNRSMEYVGESLDGLNQETFKDKDIMGEIFEEWHKQFRQIDVCRRFTGTSDGFSTNAHIDMLMHSMVYGSVIVQKMWNSIVRQKINALYEDLDEPCV